ncbi:hypothetical protein ACH5RR_000384 [Cinchona calisaya]|uniref:SBP-type domain-containing protein n=1 Tax=Cinchona calisaya TaxID=153742 RepID=A0ABD3B177_9GENT
MENSWNLFNNHNTSISIARGAHDGNNCTSNNARAFWEPNAPSRILDWSNNSYNQDSTISATAATQDEDSGVHALMFDTSHYSSSSPFPSCLYSRGGGGEGSHSQCYPDPHLMCLKLGKRHYFGDAATPLAAGDHRQVAAAVAPAAAAAGFSITKRGKPYYDASSATGGGLLVGPSTSASGVTVAATPAVVPRCQVDGCHVALVNAKDYHKRHKVCEMHSKAPKVVVLGLEQRFCQQCSRFHAVGEFDDTKRSCRRRLAGHNERRRKSSQDQSAARTQSQVNGKLMTCNGRHPYYPLSNGCALSLLSSKNNDSWISSGDLPARCSAALRELIAENRAAILARQLILDNGRQNGSNSLVNYQQQQISNNGSQSWDRIGEAEGGHVTLDLMQAPNSAFGFLSMRGKSKENEECPELWGSFGGAHVV